MSLILCKNVDKTYFGDGVATSALQSVSFSIQAGEFVAIMGPSGSGKSSLLQILGFLDRHTGGIYRFGDKTVEDYLPHELAKVRNEKMGFVFQSFNLLARSSVYDNVMLPLLYSGTKPAAWESRVKKLIASVGLSHRIDHEPSQLSGGERQRVAIARALVNDPAVIFADEPTGNLDTRSGAVIMDIFRKLNEEEGRTIVLITHEKHVAENANRILFIQDGQLISDTVIKK